MIHASDGHPLVGSPQIRVLITINKIAKNAATQNASPKKDAIASGAVENPIIPSNEYKNNFQNDHFVSPAMRSTFLNSSHLVLKPTQAKIPFVKRFFSLI